MMKLLTAVFISTVFLSTVHAQTLVMRGDHPDPSVVKIGDTYWSSATTSNWFPGFPLLWSKDLKSWKQQGYIFNKLPEWADYYFWAPEITYEKGRVYVYYAAHKKGGNLCVGVASADKPEGPYKDHGPLVCQEAGSIDGFPMRDDNGKLYLVWKEDANSVSKPTPIWAQEMNEERTALLGEKKELFRNSVKWEENLVEGVSMIRHGQYIYAFYAAAGCCGKTCNYIVGTARAKNLLGPWEKDVKNPVLANTKQWICPGHGTPIEKDGRYYFLYHAYDKRTNAFTGREALLHEFKFTADDWIEFLEPSVDTIIERQHTVVDDFKGRKLDQSWQWSVFQDAGKEVKRGRFQIGALPTKSGAFIGQKTLSGTYDVTAVVNTRKSKSAAGLAAIGDENNVVSVLFKDDKLTVVELKDGKETIVASAPVLAKKKLYLQMEVRNVYDITFLYSTDGLNYQKINKEYVSGAFLPPWDRAVRAGLVSKGESHEKAVFESFEMRGK
jgi:xylan 1,4-beta-xylosidase